jgi:hypothetical protein
MMIRNVASSASLYATPRYRASSTSRKAECDQAVVLDFVLAKTNSSNRASREFKAWTVMLV